MVVKEIPPRGFGDSDLRGGALRISRVETLICPTVKNKDNGVSFCTPRGIRTRIYIIYVIAAVHIIYIYNG